MTTTDGAGRRIDWLLRLVGFVALLVVAIFPFAATGLLAPLWVVVLAWAAWAATAYLTWRTSRHRARLTPVVPIAAAAAWYVLLVAAANAFSWTP